MNPCLQSKKSSFLSGALKDCQCLVNKHRFFFFFLKTKKKNKKKRKFKKLGLKKKKVINAFIRFLKKKLWYDFFISKTIYSNNKLIKGIFQFENIGLCKHHN